jgi:hypothetical protein
VLTWLYNGTGGSILACAVWHGAYNVATGTAAGTGTIAAVTSAFVYTQAILIVGLELRARRRGTASILGPRASLASSDRGRARGLTRPGEQPRRPQSVAGYQGSPYPARHKEGA